MFTATFDMSEVRASFRDAGRELVSGVRHAVDRACEDGANEARINHRYVDRTGTLTRSIGGHVTSAGYAAEGQGAEGVIEATAKYASFVNDGTPPHVIPGNPTLAFEWKGVPVFFRHVHHPGTHPDPFMDAAGKVAQATLDREGEAAAERAAEILNR